MTPHAPEPRQKWRHIKSGHIVTVLYIGKMQHAHEDPRFVSTLDMKDVVVYSHDGNVWVRLLSEFMDGRFILEEGPNTNA